MTWLRDLGLNVEIESATFTDRVKRVSGRLNECMTVYSIA